MPYPHRWSATEQQHRQPERIVRFGVFEFRPDTQELKKNGVRLKVQAKPLKMLGLLTNRAGQLVTRTELCNELWPDGTFVDFESGLNTATNRLRIALNDSADSPLYIETLPRLGYRFICPIVEDGPQNAEIQPVDTPATSPNSARGVIGLKLRQAPFVLLASAVFLFLAACLVFASR
jgi:DNA-binding winged helix-turn-helix (wHTH) protein